MDHKTGPTTPTEGRNQKEERIQTWSLKKGDLKHSTFKKEKKRQRNIVQMKEKPRNTQVQINKGYRQTTCKRIQSNYSKDDSKTSKIEWRKRKNQSTY